MIEITKDEKDKIRKQYPQVFINRTMKQDSKRHHYAIEESDKYLELIADTNECAAEILKKHKKFNMRFYQN